MKIALLTSDTKEGRYLRDNLPEIAFSTTSQDLDWRDFSNIDLVVSYCFKYRIKEHIFSQAKFGGINFHPAPLPQYRGFACYNFGILNQESVWGVTAHVLEQGFDTGAILLQKKFDIDENETAISLRNKSHKIMVKMVAEVLDDFEHLYKNKQPQIGSAKYYSKKRMDEARKITQKDNEDTIRRKIRAFWYPPYLGAYIENQKE